MDLKSILEKHGKWLRKEEGGESERGNKGFGEGTGGGVKA